MLTKADKIRREGSDRGFTIIEVMIVLAIAALIILIVFLAVPALQRNGRNTQRKSDVGRVSSAVTNWVSNNNGAVFVPGVGNANLTEVSNDAGTLGQYTLTPGGSFKVATGTQGVMTTVANIVVVTGAQCDTTTAGATTATGATPHQMAIQYALETSGGTGNPVCLNI